MIGTAKLQFAVAVLSRRCRGAVAALLRRCRCSCHTPNLQFTPSPSTNPNRRKHSIADQLDGSQAVGAANRAPGSGTVAPTGGELQPLEEDGHVDSDEAMQMYGEKVVFEDVNGECVDDITGLPMEPKFVNAGRRENLEGFHCRGIYNVRDRAWAERYGISVLVARGST